MTIRIYNDRIQFANYSLVVTPKGLSINVSNTNITANITAANCGPIPVIFQGLDLGFTAGGGTGYPTPVVGTIDKFPFAAQENFISVGSLTVARQFSAGCSSRINGYVAGGTTGTRSNVIDKFTFASNINATDVGDLLDVYEGGAGTSSDSAGYVAGGYNTPGSATTTVQKFSFASDLNSTSLPASDAPSALNTSRAYAAGVTDSNFGYGYVVGGAASPTSAISTIERIKFSLDGMYPRRNLSSLIALGTARMSGAGLSSENYGYFSGGTTTIGGTTSTNVQRFPFAIYASAVEISGISTQARYGAGGISSKHSGYVSGGFTFPTLTSVSTVDKFPFVSEYAPASTVGNLTSARGGVTGHQI